MLIQLLINGIIMGSIYALVSLGYALVYNTTRTFHIAYAALYMMSSYFLYSFYSLFQWPFILSFFLAVSLTTFFSIMIEKLVYQPLEQKYSTSNIIMISSLGVMIVLINFVAMLHGNETKILNPNISSTISFGKVILTYSQIAQFSCSLLLIVVFLLYLKHSKLGIKTRALRDDEELFKVLGQNINRMRLIVFTLSGVFVSVGGILVAYDVGMDPYVGMPMLLNAIVALIIGGVGRFEAPVVGGFIIGILQSLSVWAFSARWQDAVTFLLLILFLAFRPQGIMGEKERVV